MRRLWPGLLALILVLLLAGYALRGPIARRALERTVAANMRTDLVRELPDGLHLALCGAGSPLPDPKRAGPCTAVIAGRRLFVVDAGAGSPRVLSRMRIPQGEIEAVFLTHFHSDHIDGLGELMLQRWANGGRSAPLPVIGPAGVEQVVDGINAAYGQDRRYRVAHHGPEVVPPSGAGGVAQPFAPPADGAGVVLIEDGGLTITAFRVEHAPVEPAVGYRFDYGGRSLVLSGDTARSANLAHFAEGADVLVHEALAPQLVEVLTREAEAAGRRNLAQITRDIVDYHTTPVEAAELAREAGVKLLLLNHIVPPLPVAPLEQLFLEGVADVYEGPVQVGRDGTLVRLPAGSDAIEVVELL